MGLRPKWLVSKCKTKSLTSYPDLSNRDILLPEFFAGTSKQAKLLQPLVFSIVIFVRQIVTHTYLTLIIHI